VCAATGRTSTKDGKVPVVDQDCMETVPETLGGCGLGEAGDSTCVPTVDTDVFGCVPVEAGSPLLGLYPKFLCGCEGSTATELGCLNGVPKDVCGTAAETSYLPRVPTFVCGCGDDPAQLDTGFASVCMSNVDKLVCGSFDTLRTDRGDPGDDPADCLTDVPEFARGCGPDTEPTAANPTCLRDTLALFGCDNVPNEASAIPRVPEYLCGCGEETAYTGVGLPCLSFVGDNTTSGDPICGATPITSTAQVLPVITNDICGCDDGVQGDDCLDNVPKTVCGPRAICSPVATPAEQGDCAADTLCKSLLPEGAPDAIGDICEPVP